MSYARMNNDYYGPKNTPMVPAFIPADVNPYFPNPYSIGQVRTGARVDPAYVPEPEPIHQQWSRNVLKGANSHLAASTKSKRGRNVHLLNSTNAPRATAAQDFFF